MCVLYVCLSNEEFPERAKRYSGAAVTRRYLREAGDSVSFSLYISGLNLFFDE